ncbi:hypothetical protein ACLOJK_012125 [Asimina triloba]
MEETKRMGMVTDECQYPDDPHIDRSFPKKIPPHPITRLERIKADARKGTILEEQREIGAAERKKGFKEKEVKVEVDFSRWEESEEEKGVASIDKEEERIQGEGGRWEESEKEKGDWHRSARRKKGFKGPRGQQRDEAGKQEVDDEARQREAKRGNMGLRSVS